MIHHFVTVSHVVLPSNIKIDESARPGSKSTARVAKLRYALSIKDEAAAEDEAFSSSTHNPKVVSVA